jgi:PST family polysaccharide transporter
LSLSRKLFAGTLWSGAETVVRQCLGLAVFVLLARELGSTAIGTVALALALVTLLETLVSDAAVECLVQRHVVTSRHLDAAFWTLLAAATAMAGGLALAAPLAGRLFAEPDLAPTLQALGLMLPLSALAAVPAALLKRRFQFRPFVLRAFAFLLVGGGLGLWLAFAGFGHWALVAMHLGGTAAATLCIGVAARWRPRFRARHRHLRDLLGFSAYASGTKLVTILDQRWVVVAIGYFLGTTEVGLFHMARRILELLFQVLLTPLNQIALPALSRLRDEPERLGRLQGFVEGAVALSSFPAMIGLAAVAPAAVEVLLGPSWRPMVPALQLLCLSGPMVAVEYNTPILARALGRPELAFRQTLLAALVGIPLFVLAAQVSVTVVAAAVLLRQAVLIWPLRVLLVRRLTGRGLAARYLPLLPSLGCALAMGLCVALLGSATPEMSAALGLAAGVSLGIVSFLVLLALFARADVIDLSNQVRTRLQRNASLAVPSESDR